MTEPATAAGEEPLWEQRFRAPRVGLPEWAEDCPEHCVFESNVTGTWEIYAWDRATGDQRQVTSRPHGTSDATIDPTGQWIWWFDDTDGDEFGVWRKQPFAGGPDVEAAPGVPAAYSAGLALGRSGLAVVGCSDDDATTVYVCEPGAEPRVLYRHAEDAHVVDLSDDETLVLLQHSEHGDSRHPALRVVRTADGTAVADLWDGPGRGLDGVGFEPHGHRVLGSHERHDRSAPLLWDITAEPQTDVEIDLGLPGESGADWSHDGTTLLVHHDHRGRSTLHRYDLATGALTLLTDRPGVVSEATELPDGTVWLDFSSSAESPSVVDLAGSPVLTPKGFRAFASVRAHDVDVPTDHGTVHAFLSQPEGVSGPQPTVFIVHGGPEAHDADEFRRDIAAYVDLGVSVVTVNYRGSTGYGAAWRDAMAGAVGRTELADVLAVRDHLVADGTIDPSRVALTGGSWGGFLTLLGIGTQPDSWTCAVAQVPVADYRAAYDDEMEQLKAFDRSLFGGSPDEVPEAYDLASPITYVDRVRVPLLILAGANDPRCPIRQIDNYVAALSALGRPPEVYRFDAGHGSLVIEERIRQMRVELDFIRRNLLA